ncbi:nucleotide exchange factor GrpE [bacterium]|nr:nucleotide exchange factor GrpE [bacterium]
MKGKNKKETAISENETAEIEPEIKNESEKSIESAEPKSSEDIIAELQSENESLKDRLLRKTAEFENFRKRQERILFTMIEQERNNIIGRLLDVATDVERAMREVEDEKDPEAIYNGIKLVSKRIRELLKLEGVESNDPTGKKFDPLEHDAIAVQPVDSPDEDGIVIQSIQPSYIRQGKLVSPARVIVGKYDEPNESKENKNNEGGE